MIRIDRPEVGLILDGFNLIVHTQNQTITLALTHEELIRLTAELYDLDPAPLLCGTTAETACKPNCCGGMSRG